jgi:phage-related protein
LNFANRIAGAGKIAGLTTKEVFAIGSAMASVGVEAEAGGTAVQKVLLDINTSVVTGGKNLAIFGKTAGMTAQEFAVAWKESPQEAFTAFVQGLGKQGDQAILTLQDLGMEDQRLIRSFLSLANAGSLLNDQFRFANVEWRENTRLTMEAEKRYATTASQMQIFKNNMTDLGITIGAALLPSINRLIGALIPLIEQFASFAEKHPNIIAGLLGFGIALGVVGAAMMALAPIMMVLAAGLLPVLIPIILIGVAIAALITAGILLIANWQSIVAWAGNIWGQIVVTITTALTALQSFFVSIWTQIQLFFITIWTAIQEWFIAFWNNLVNNIIVQMLMMLAMLIYNVLMLIQSFWQLVWTTILTVIQTIIYAILAVIQTVMSAINAVITSIMNAIKAFFSAIWNAIRADVTNILNQIKTIVTTIWNAI